VTSTDCIDDRFCTELKLQQSTGNGGWDLLNHVLVSRAEGPIGLLEGNIEQEQKTVHDEVGTGSTNTKDDAAHYTKQ